MAGAGMRVQPAYSFELVKCSDPRCNLMHFRLIDEDGHPFASLSLTLQQIPSVIKAMQDHAYEMATQKDDLA